MKYFLLLLATLWMPLVSAADCQSDRLKLQILGSRGPEFLSGRASTGYLVWLDDKARVIIDAGPGSARNFAKSGANYDDLRVILFSHFHVDHANDFAAYVKAGFFTDRSAGLRIIGPSGSRLVSSADDFVQRQIGKQGAYPYLSPFIDPDAASSYKITTTSIAWSEKNLEPTVVYQDSNMTIRSVPVHHGAFPALGYRVETAGCVISFTGDMSGRLGAMPDLASGSDILVAHNAIPENAEGVPALLHMKPSYIGRMAARAGVKKLLLTHLMRRTINNQQETTALIRKHYGGPIVFADDLDVFRP